MMCPRADDVAIERSSAELVKIVGAQGQEEHERRQDERIERDRRSGRQERGDTEGFSGDIAVHPP